MRNGTPKMSIEQKKCAKVDSRFCSFTMLSDCSQLPVQCKNPLTITCLFDVSNRLSCSKASLWSNIPRPVVLVSKSLASILFSLVYCISPDLAGPSFII